MARRKRKEVNLTSELIEEQINTNQKQILELSEKIKKLKLQNKNLEKELIITKENEKNEADKQMFKELTDLIKEKGLSLEEVKNILNSTHEHE